MAPKSRPRARVRLWVVTLPFEVFMRLAIIAVLSLAFVSTFTGCKHDSMHDDHMDSGMKSDMNSGMKSDMNKDKSMNKMDSKDKM